jgi:hypothetical protein
MVITRHPAGVFAVPKCTASRWVSDSSARRRDQITSMPALFSEYAVTFRSGTLWLILLSRGLPNARCHRGSGVAR